MKSYYNEFEPYAVKWLGNLSAANLIAPGHIDPRSIEDVRAEDLDGYDQCHFFAGIGGWSLALQIAGWPEDRQVFTGSSPCQDNSNAAAISGRRLGLRGKRSGLAHTWLDLVEARNPECVWFENVPGISPWLAEITDRLEGFGYRVSRREYSTADIVGPHLRRRVWVVADRYGAGLEKPRPSGPFTAFSDPRRTAPGDVWSTAPERPGGMADGFPCRVAAIRAFGNAIDPWVAGKVIRDYLEDR